MGLESQKLALYSFQVLKTKVNYSHEVIGEAGQIMGFYLSIGSTELCIATV